MKNGSQSVHVIYFVVIGISLLLLFPNRYECMRFELRSGHTKCISEDIKSNAMTVGKYYVVNPNELQPLPDLFKITVRLTTSLGNNYHYADNMETGHFAFTAVESGDYTACFWLPDHHNSTITVIVDFDWRTGVHAKDWGNVAKKGNIEVMEMELKKMYEQVISIQEEMFYLRGREDEMQELNKSTNSEMAALGFLSLIICLSVAGMQLWHLKTFFEKKKII
ncbi:hypothetical protein ACFE04_024640 [Oxalis oulophora]